MEREDRAPFNLFREDSKCLWATTHVDVAHELHEKCDKPRNFTVALALRSG